MGVHGLWTVVQPCARPVKLETLAQKRLAVDASIWIYQFLKAVRDKEGNALRNSHIVGFFRRIVKLLFHGIRPVFVFDGGAPLLKRQTISGRKSRREGRKEDAIRTAGKLLSLQMQRRAQDEAGKRKRAAQHRDAEEPVEIIPENVIYADEIGQSAAERQKSRQFRKKDAYHLPELASSISEMGAPNDPRIMSTAELETYAAQFEGGEDINLYDFSKIDFDGMFFTSLPAGDRYNILNAARLRSRLRMGLSKEQLDAMFPNRLDFSKFQIERVKERNDLTQRLMNLNGMNDDIINRVAGEKNREYVLVKNDGVEGGWALGVVGFKGEREGEGKRTAIVIEDTEGKIEDLEEESEEEEDFEDIPIEGLNRVPKKLRQTTRKEIDADVNEDFQRAINESLRPIKKRKILPNTQDAPLFIQDDEGDGEIEDGADMGAIIAEDEAGARMDNTEEEELRKAIALSLERDRDEGRDDEETLRIAIEMSEHNGDFDDEDDRYGYGDDNAADYGYEENNAADFEEPMPKKPVPLRGALYTEPSKSSAPALLSLNPNKHKPAVVELNSSGGFIMEDDEDDGFDLSTIIEATRSSAVLNNPSLNPAKNKEPLSLLPFERLDIGLGFGGLKKKLEEKSKANVDGTGTPKKMTAPLPPWFSGAENTEFKKGEAKFIHEEQRPEPLRRARSPTPEINSRLASKAKLNREKSTVHHNPMLERDTILDDAPEVVDLAAEKLAETIDLVSDDEKTAVEEEGNKEMDDVIMSDVADIKKALPVVDEQLNKPTEKNTQDEYIEWSDSDHEASSLPTNRRNAQAPNNVIINVEPLSSPMSFSSQPASLVRKESTLDDVDEDAQVADIDYFSDSDEEELVRHLDEEATEHARFASTFNNAPIAQNAEDYERELRQLRNQQKKDRRDADEVTHIMVTECQQLLQMFGIPYITAPMEAEAQCAELVKLGLVDGIVTDDSDIFLFGGTRVYKNMFNQAKFVECYLTSDLEMEYSLDRQKLIRIAHLLGSDYTEGLPGVGPVTALELLAEFGGERGLNDFKDWWTMVQTGYLDPAADDNKFRKKFRKLSEKLFLPAIFPDERVDIAYLEPEVDHDPSAFEWGVPDLDGLRTFLMSTIGWSPDRTDEVLVPVIRDMNRKLIEGTQTNITNFFSGGVGAGAFAPRVRDSNKSKRMESALMSLHNQSTSAKKRKEKQGYNSLRRAESGLADSSDEEAVVMPPPMSMKQAAAAAAKKTTTKKKVPAKPKTKIGAKRKSNVGEEDLEDSDEEMMDVAGGSSSDEVLPQKSARAKATPKKAAITASTRGRKKVKN